MNGCCLIVAERDVMSARWSEPSQPTRRSQLVPLTDNCSRDRWFTQSRTSQSVRPSGMWTVNTHTRRHTLTVKSEVTIETPVGSFTPFLCNNVIDIVYWFKMLTWNQWFRTHHMLTVTLYTKQSIWSIWKEEAGFNDKMAGDWINLLSVTF